MSITSIARYIFTSRMRELEQHQTQGEQLQRAVLSHLIASGKDTALKSCLQVMLPLAAYVVVSANDICADNPGCELPLRKLVKFLIE